MDRPPPLEQRDVKPGLNLTATDTRTQTTVEVTHEAGIPLRDSEKIVKIQTKGNASVSTSYRSANISEELFTRRHGPDNICGSMNSQGSNTSSLETSKDADVSRGSRGYSVPLDLTVCSVYTHNRNKSVTNCRKTKENNQAHKRTKSEICNKRHKDLSTDNKEKDINFDKALDSSTARQTAFDTSLFAGIDRKVQTIQQSLSSNYENLTRKKILLSPGQNIASNIGITKISRNNAPSEISDSVASQRKGVCSVDNILSDPGPSDLRRNDSMQSCRDAFQSFPQSETQSINFKDDKVFTCRVCRAEIAKHATEKNIFKCCVCLYHNSKEAILQMHSYTHVPKRICNICEKEHAEGNLHDSEHACIVCLKKFQCRTQLYEHFLDHEYYFKRNCWVCSRTFYDHFTKEDGYISYLCCVCGFTSVQEGSFETHNLLHLPKFFCKLCREDYSEEEKWCHGSEVTCFVCPQTFKCVTQLEDHSKHHEGCCMLCKESLTKHIIRQEGKKSFLCCYDKCLKRIDKKITFQNHLYSHTGLRSFKCNSCRRRFSRAGGGHLQSCKALPYECYICETNFHSIDSLHAHCLVKHSHT